MTRRAINPSLVARHTCTARRTLVMVVALVAWIGSVPASGAAAEFPADHLARASAAPAPTFEPVWIRHDPAIRAGSVAHFVLDPVSATRCRISLSGPRAGGRRAIRIRGGGLLVRLTVHTRRSAQPGRWRLSARCAQPSGPDLASSVTAFVRPAGRAGTGPLATRRDIRLRRSSAFADRGRAGRISGRGVGANPFDPTQCTSLAYDRRQDVYDRAIAAGVRRNGLVANPAFSEDYVWNGKRWAENARRAGIPTGSRPIAGALFVSTTGRYGHVAYVERVFNDGSFLISERNATGSGTSTAITRRTQYPGRSGVEFVYGGPAGEPGNPVPQPQPLPPPPASPADVTLTVYNKVTNGGAAMREDTPAYLSTVPRNYCRRDGCSIAGTDRNTGGTYAPAVCQTQSVRTTNGHDGEANDDANPGLFSSTRWYGIRVNGSLAYISEVWVDPSQRGGLGLPTC